LASHQDKTHSHESVSGDAGPRIESETFIQHRIRNLIAEFVRVSLGDGLRRKEHVLRIKGHLSRLHAP
jgi:hypothetical protein